MVGRKTQAGDSAKGNHRLPVGPGLAPFLDSTLARPEICVNAGGLGADQVVLGRDEQHVGSEAATAGQVMPSKVNAAVPDAEVPTIAILEGAEGRPFESIAQMATRSVTLADSEENLFSIVVNGT
jgi:hypothetical protein